LHLRRHTRGWRRPHFFLLFLALAAVCIALFFYLPSIIVWSQTAASAEPFPVGVDPERKLIHENAAAAVLFDTSATPLSAATANAGGVLRYLGAVIASSRVYELFAGTGSVPHVVTVNPGTRKEQVAALFGKSLRWDSATQKLFTNLPPVSNEDLNEGTIAPGDYAVSGDSSVAMVQTEIKARFDETVLSRYTPDVQKVVPLNEGLTIASILERETSDPDEMRLISGILWNRIFAGMKLQMDSTLQYAKANGRGTWWPQVVPRDKYINSPYNTYQNVGLPPGPISNPSVAAVLAALNPKKTTCLFYFHDDDGDFHCSDTYVEHVAELKKEYGRGK
jgi:cell division protein YceG involved in septum cleavage